MPSTPPGRQLDYLIRIAAQRLRRARRSVALTGAGLSVESGVPPFRGGGTAGAGLWERYDPMVYATVDAFRRDPERVWMMLREIAFTLKNARPSPGHVALSRLESEGLLARVITQNIDGLHQLAGSREVIEFHGNWRSLSCFGCGSRTPTEQVSLARLPPRCACGEALRPDVTLFGEIIPADAIDAAHEEVRACDCLLVIGTSAEVVPAALLPEMARSAGACVIEINTRSTTVTDRVAEISLRGPAGVILPRLLQEMGLPAAC
jgi:NAD-dependent deacetylase